MTIRIFQVDAFTTTPFSGNPAAVCLLPGPQTAGWMQQVGAEMNLSETAFIWPLDQGYSLRWFTPATEVSLCGHATLASAHILWETGTLQLEETAVFQTKSGPLTCTLNNGWIAMNFPAKQLEPAIFPAEMGAVLGITPKNCVQFGPDKYLVEVESEEILRAINPDFSALLNVKGRAVCVTSRAESAGIDFVSRYFAPWIGINEDPVTGSSHTALTPYWVKELGKENLVAFQASTRGGLLRLRPDQDRVIISGQAVTILEGKLLA